MSFLMDSELGYIITNITSKQSNEDVNHNRKLYRINHAIDTYIKLYQQNPVLFYFVFCVVFIELVFDFRKHT